MSPKIVLAVFFLLLNGVFNPLYAAGPTMVDKDLFSIDRKPPALHSENASSKAGGRETAVGNIALDGVIILNNNKKAILRINNMPAGKADDAGNPPSPFIVVREGETVKGYRVIRIKFRSVSLQRDGKTYTIDLFADNKGSAPAPGAAAQPSSTPARQAQPYEEGGSARSAGLPRGIPELPPGIKTGFKPGKPPQAPPSWKPPSMP